ncbi:MAG: DUF1614 domain-containing protein [Planctomycetaceae bacterium]
MSQPEQSPLRWNWRSPQVGCLAMAVAGFLICLLPYVVVGAMQEALARLHLYPFVATIAVVATFIGSLINIPVYRHQQDELTPDRSIDLKHLGQTKPRFHHVQSNVVIAVNLGGCVVPVLVGLWQIVFLATSSLRVLLLCGIISVVNVVLCYRAARPVPSVGILMPMFLSPLVAVGLSLLLIRDPVLRPSAAFVAAIAGPLIGADILRLHEMTRIKNGILSIGGAGSFDGIVVSGLIAAFIA